MKQVFLCGLFLSIIGGVRAQNFTHLGDATQNASCNCFTITPDAGNQSGAFYQTHTINLTNSFDFIFSAYWGCGTNCGGNADGMVFALTSNPGTLGGAGQSLGWGNGYGSQPCSVGVEFDTWVNGGSCSSGGECDPNYNELAIMANGDVCHCDAGNTLAGYVPIQPNQAAVYDCNWHTVEINWNVNTGTLSVSFDGNLRLQYVDMNMITDWFCGNPTVYWGWSGSTGGGCELQEVCIKSTSSWIAGSNYQSCIDTVQFTDVQTVNASNVASWGWQFGDGGTSNVQNPAHVYSGPGVYTVQLVITDTHGCTDTFSHIVTIAAPIVIGDTIANPLCNGALDGSILVGASQGFGPSAGLGGYKFSWNTGSGGTSVVGLSAGTYAVTCTDGICTSTASYTLTQPTALTASTSSTATNCNGSTGSVSITVSGGTTPYSQVEWVAPPAFGNTVTGLPAGTYVANFTDANGCSAALEYKATVASLPCGYNLSSSYTDVTCNGGSNGTITVTESGASVVQPLTYVWSPAEPNNGNLTGLAAGTYNYSVQDASGNAGNGPFTGSIVINQPAPVVASLTITNATCSGANGQAIASVVSGGVSPFTYTWSGGQANNPIASGLSPGPITVTVTDHNGCTATATGTVSGPVPLITTVSMVADSCFYGQGPQGSATANPSGGASPYSYIWNDSAVAQTAVGLVGGPYSVTVTDADGCTASATGAVSTLTTSALNPTITPQNVACFGGTTGSITVSPAGGTAPYNYTWYPDSTASGPNQTGLATGRYGVTVADAYGCQVHDTVLITQPASAISVSTSVKNVSCNGGSNGYVAFSITGGTPPYTYMGIPIPNADTIKNLPAGDYSAVIADANNCTITVYDTITQPGPQSITFSGVTDETCFGQAIGTVTATFVNGTAPINYLWSDTMSGPTISNLPANTYTVTGTDANGCTELNSVTITQPAAIPLPVTVNSNAACYGGTGTVTAAYSGGTPPYTYSWSAPITGNVPTVNPPAGNYTVTGTDANQCGETATFSVTQPTQIVIGIAKANVLCFGGTTGSITLTVSGGSPGYTYAWTPGTVPAVSNPTGLAAGTYTVTVTDAANCTSDSSTIITQPAQPLSVVEDSTDVMCFGQSTASISLAVLGGTRPYSYTWNPPVSTDSAATGLAVGSYDYTVQDANACQLSGGVDLTEPASAISVITSQVNVLCFDSSTGSATITASGGTPPYTYTWNPNAGNAATVNNILAGSYSVTVTDNNGCTISSPFVITQPQAGLSETETQTNENCSGDAIGSIAISVSGGTGSYTYAWNPSVSTRDSANNLTAGTYGVTVTDSVSCSLGKSYTVTQPGTLGLNAVATPDSCYGQSNGIIVATADSGSAPYTYSANNGGGSISSPNGQFSGLAAGSYTVSVTDNNGCSDTTSATITQPALLSADTSSISPSCYGYSNGSVTVTGTGGVPNYTYQFSNGVTNSTGADLNLPQGTYAVTVTDANGCTATDSVTLVQPDSLVIQITPSAGQVNLGDSLQLQTSVNQGGIYNYFWYPNSGLSCYNCPNPLFNGVYSLTYQVTISNSDSCTAQTSFTVTVVPNYNIYLPNVFAPIGASNPANQFWQLFGDLSSVKQVYVMVFDRIGEKVFESDDLNFKWDGTYKGRPAPEGVYVYTIKFVWLDNHSDDTRKGSITLLR